MKRALLAILPLLSMACSLLSARPTPTHLPPIVLPATQTGTESPKPLPSETPPPPATAIPSPAPVLGTVQIGAYLPLSLIYDTAVWREELRIAGTSTQTGQDVFDLVHRQYDCLLHDNLGHGVPETWTYAESLQEIGGAQFQVSRWLDTASGEVQLAVYQYPVGAIEDSRRIELEMRAGNGEACQQAAEEVLRLSLAEITAP